MPKTSASALGARDETGKPVDWWFMYKVSEKSQSTGKPASGTEYLYMDANGARRRKPLALSPNRIDGKRGALQSTLQQLYAKGAKANKNLGWYFYNDQYPAGVVVGSRGHTKGVLAFDLRTNGAFWLVQSTPEFPPTGKYGYPMTGHEMAQTFLCVSLANADTAKQIAHQMFVAQQPNVYGTSALPTALRKDANDPRRRLIHDEIAVGSTPVTSDLPFLSRAGAPFRVIAKNKTWGHDFYNDLVGPALHDNLDVETWGHDTAPADRDSDKIHKIVPMHSVNLRPLGLPYSWSEEVDHAKLAISDKSEPRKWVCVGDLNFTIAQEKRGGGTVCFQNAALWKSLSRILSAAAEPPRKKK